MSKKYCNTVLKEKLFDLINGNGAIEILEGIAEHTLITASKFNLNDIERNRVFNAHINVLKGEYHAKPLHYKHNL